MPIIVIPSKGNGGLNSEISPIFGRCECFTLITIVNKKINAVKTIPNSVIKGEGSYGIKAAQLIENHKGEILITEHIGPNAFDKLKALNIKVLEAPKNTKKIKDVVELFIKGELKDLQDATKGSYNKYD